MYARPHKVIERPVFKPLEHLSDNISTYSTRIVLTHGGHLYPQRHGTVYDVRTDTTYSSEVLMGFRTWSASVGFCIVQSRQLHDGLEHFPRYLNCCMTCSGFSSGPRTLRSRCRTHCRHQSTHRRCTLRIRQLRTFFLHCPTTFANPLLCTNPAGCRLSPSFLIRCPIPCAIGKSEFMHSIRSPHLPTGSPQSQGGIFKRLAWVMHLSMLASGYQLTLPPFAEVLSFFDSTTLSSPLSTTSTA